MTNERLRPLAARQPRIEQGMAPSSEPIVFAVPAAYREHVPSEAAVVAFDPVTLTLEPAAADADPADQPAFDRVADAFPTDPDRAIPLAIAIGCCDSVATNRGAIESLLRTVERAGCDPLLVIDRLVADSGVEPAIDLERRAHQLEQLLY